MKKINLLVAALLMALLSTAQVRLVLNETEKATLARLAEEEKLAYDVYMDMAELWEAQAFAQIAAAEQRHLHRIQVLASRYGITMTKAVRAGERGLFDDPGLQQSYLDLTKKGQQSLTAAFQVGAYIEEMDIRDLKLAIAETDNPQLQSTYQHLLEGSNRHLVVFSNHLEEGGSAYVPSFITTADYDAIMRNNTKACKGRPGQQRGCQGQKHKAEAGCAGKGANSKACCSKGKGKNRNCQGRKASF